MTVDGLKKTLLCLGNLDEQISRQKFSAHLLTVLPDPSPGRLPRPPYGEIVFVR